jgi:short-subunit dehydrogenase
MELDGCNALITGASAGIGLEFARQLASRATTLILIARRRQRLEGLRSQLAAKNKNLRVEIRPTDLSKHDEIEELLRWLEAEKLIVDLLINNAGLGDLGSFATSSPERNEEMMLVNMVALTRLTRALLPPMIVRKHGAILNVSSSASFLPIANFAIYAATKAYVTSFSEAIFSELRGTGVSVCALCPGPVRTEFNDMVQRPGEARDRSPEFVYVPVEQVVRDALAAVEADRPLIIPGFLMKVGMFLVRLTPMSILRWASRFSPKRG